MPASRSYAWVLIVVATLAALSPVVPAFRGRKGDSFPLSWFPMFAGTRPTVETPTYIVGVEPDGTRVKVDVSFWTSGGFNQGRNMLTTALRSSHGGPKLCEAVAKKVAKRGRAEHREVTELKIVRGSYDRARFFGGHPEPLIERVLARCDVVR